MIKTNSLWLGLYKMALGRNENDDWDHVTAFLNRFLCHDSPASLEFDFQKVLLFKGVILKMAFITKTKSTITEFIFFWIHLVCYLFWIKQFCSFLLSSLHLII